MHVKSYGLHNLDGDSIVVTSSNFTGPGMSQNVEMAVLLNCATTRELGFSWGDLISSMQSQNWDYYTPQLGNTNSVEWQMLYDEKEVRTHLYDSERMTMLVCLGHADTVRINASPHSKKGRGTQYFWLSKDCYDFFPALTIPNLRGEKRTYSCLIKMRFVDIDLEVEVRVTFEAENNLDFRLGTGPLKHSKLVESGDIAAISRVGDFQYELRLYRRNSKNHNVLLPYATNSIGNRNKRYGYISNEVFQRITSGSMK